MKQNLIGESPAFLAVLDKVSQLAPIERPVLIIGERGTGKELIAQRLHYLSRRWDKPLLSLNCATLSEGLIDSELFGHESGSFTGSKGKHKGRFERAEGGIAREQARKGRSIDGAEDRAAVLHKRYVDRELSVTVDEFLRAVQRIDQPGLRPDTAQCQWRNFGLFGDQGYGRRQFSESCGDDPVRAQISLG